MDNSLPYSLDQIQKRRQAAMDNLMAARKPQFDHSQWHDHVNIISHIKTLDMTLLHLSFEIYRCKKKNARPSATLNKLVKRVNSHIDNIESKLVIYNLKYLGNN